MRAFAAHLYAVINYLEFYMVVPDFLSEWVLTRSQ